MNLYHVTTPEAASAIVAGGFRDGERRHQIPAFPGVWLTDDPISINVSDATCSKGEVFLRVALDADEEALQKFELITDGFDGPPIVGANYREWLVPAAWVNRHATRIEIVADDDDLRTTLPRERKPIPALPPAPGPKV